MLKTPFGGCSGGEATLSAGLVLCTMETPVEARKLCLKHAGKPGVQALFVPAFSSFTSRFSPW